MSWTIGDLGQWVGAGATIVVLGAVIKSVFPEEITNDKYMIIGFAILGLLVHAWSVLSYYGMKDDMLLVLLMILIGLFYIYYIFVAIKDANTN